MADAEEQRLPDDSSSEHVFDFYCEFCREDGKMLEAEGYCVDCCEYLCGTCYTHHRRSRGNRHHVLLDKDDMPQDTPLDVDQVNKDISNRCEHHPGKVVKYYCCSHDSLGCSTCFFKHHRYCNNVDNILEKADSVIESKEYKDFIQMLNQFDQRFRSNIKRAKNNITRSQDWCSEIAESLHKFREEINTVLDELEKSIITKAEELQKEEENKLMNASDNSIISLESVEKLVGEFDQLQSARKVCEIYIKIKESKREANVIQAKLYEAEKENAISDYAFYPDITLKEFLNNLDGLGKLYAHGPGTDIAMALSNGNCCNTTARHVSDIKMKSRKDSSISSITGSAVVSNNRLVIVDEVTNKVQLIDTRSNSIVSELTVPSYPWDVTMISRHQAAITLQSSNAILLLNVSYKLTLDRHIAVGGRCEGVAYSNRRLVVTYIYTARLEIMDLSGKVTKTVQRDDEGKDLFVYPQYACISKDGETIYVSDRDSNKVISLTFKGVVKAVYCDSNLRNPQKVCVDPRDNVYVCGRDSRNIHMLNSGLSFIKVILTQADGLDYDLYSVSHCHETNRLFIGMKNKMKVYQLS